MNVNQHGQIYLKEFVIDKTVQFETILHTSETLFVWTPVFTSNRIIVHHSQFYTMSLSARQLLSV